MSARRDDPDGPLSERHDPHDIKDRPSVYVADYDPVTASIIDDAVRLFAKTADDESALRKTFMLAHSAGKLAGIRIAKETFG